MASSSYYIQPSGLTQFEQCGLNKPVGAQLNEIPQIAGVNFMSDTLDVTTLESVV